MAMPGVLPGETIQSCDHMNLSRYLVHTTIELEAVKPFSWFFDFADKTPSLRKTKPLADKFILIRDRTRPRLGFLAPLWGRPK